MNPWQMAQQLKQELETVVWPSGSGDVVFGSRGVTVFAGVPTEQQIPPGFPWALVSIDDATADETHPDLLEQTYTILTGVSVAGDPLGEHALIGGAVADLGKSAGRGVAEVSARARAAVESLTGSDGAHVTVSATNLGSPTTLGRGKHLALADFTVTAVCTSDLFYAAPQRLKHDGIRWSWVGTHCDTRFDFLQYVLVKKSGATASTSPSDGTTLFSGDATEYLANADSATTYTVFAEYAARGGSTADGNSEPEVGSYRVVT